MQDVNTAISYALYGTTATQISTFSSDTTYDLNVQMDEKDLSTMSDLGNLLIQGNNGNIRLDTIASFSITNGPSTISREDKKRINHVTAKLADGYTASEVQSKVQAALDEHFTTPDGVVIGQNGDMPSFLGKARIGDPSFAPHSCEEPPKKPVWNPFVSFIPLPYGCSQGTQQSRQRQKGSMKYASS